MRRPRVLLAGRNRYRLPLDRVLAAKFAALEGVLDVRVLGSAADGSAATDPRFALAAPARPRALDGVAFYAALPLRIARELRRFRPDAVLAQSPYEAAAALLARRLARSPARVVADVHGDWRTFARLYGSPGRRLLAPIADRVSSAALRRVDAVRTVSPYTSRIVREAGLEPAAEFPAFMELEPFLATPPEPLPERPQALFVGVLERYKNVDGLARAWRLAAPRVPGAGLRIVGRGALAPEVEALVRELPGQTSWTPAVPPHAVAAALDRSTLLVLPSRSEGMGRVVVEALCRGRPVVASRVGGIPDLVEDGVTGLLVRPGDDEALAAALIRILGDPGEAERLAAAARPAVEAWLPSAGEYAARLRDLVDRVAGQP